jgi:hypothetical protein
MKKLGFIFGLISILSSCTESLPPVNMTPIIGLVKTTTSRVDVSDLPNAEYRSLLIEDVTGVRCTACPNAAKIAADIKSNATTNEVVVVGVYPKTPKSLTTYINGYEDLFYETRLTTELSQLIAQNIYVIGGTLPGGGLNRRVLDGKINVDYNTWTNYANSFVGEKSIVNLETELMFLNDSIAEVKLKTTFVNDAAASPFVTVFLLEDNLKYPQYFIDDSTAYEYKHKHVLREAYTPYNGTPLLSDGFTDAVKGVVSEQEWNLVIPKYIVKENASVLIMVNYNDGANQEVIQCREIKLK